MYERKVEVGKFYDVTSYHYLYPKEQQICVIEILTVNKYYKVDVNCYFFDQAGYKKVYIQNYNLDYVNGFIKPIENQELFKALYT